ncbi:hypothetical protein [Williamsia muralis]|uniref:hypothetical protein n=1 Tax=Williamsia marianensis TaxID=85044 RepID=UPI000DE6D291|nr:hypothetical protein [Williamsia marianensis]PVY27395.1 hypothetical protein C7458_11161 [Williamsia marianensis]
MLSRFGRFAAILVVGAALSAGVLVPSGSASAQPVAPGAQFKYFNIHMRSPDGGAGDAHCVRTQPFGREDTRCDATGYYDDSQAAGFVNSSGGVVYSPDGRGNTYLKFYTRAGEVIEGTIPSRGSADFTISSFRSPAFGVLARTGQKLYLDVRTTDHGQTTGDRWYDFYLHGDLVINTPVGGGYLEGLFDDFLEGVSGAFGSS